MIMSSTMVSRRLLSFMLILMLRYGEAYKSNANYLEAILVTLGRIENSMVKLAKHGAVSCTPPPSHHSEKLPGPNTDHTKNHDDDEVFHGLLPHAKTWNPHVHSTNLVNIRRTISHSDEEDDYQIPVRKPKRSRSSSRTQSVNTNSNINANINSNRYHLGHVHHNKESHLHEIHNDTTNANVAQEHNIPG